MIKRILNFFIGPRAVPVPRPEKSVEEIFDAITRPAVVNKRERYVVGFAFHSHGEPNVRPKVVLIRKVKPDWQAGKLNGVGGKIEQGESPEQAMAREFQEEAGIISDPIDWAVFARCEFRGAQVVFLRAFDEAFARSKTMTPETIEHRAVFGIDEIPEGRIIPNLRWLIPLAWHFEPTREVVVVSYDGRN